MLSRIVNTSLLAGLVIFLQQSGLPCRAALQDPGAIKETANNSIELADAAKRAATVRQLWGKYQRLGIAAARKNDWEVALQMFEQAVQEAELPNFDQVDLALSLDYLASAYQQVGKSQDSLMAAKKAFEIRSRLAGDNKEAQVTALLRLGELYLETGDYANAKTYLHQALSLANSVSAGSSLLDRISDSLVSVSLATHDRSGAKAYLATLLRHDEGRPADENSANHLEQNARILWQEGNLNEARNCLSRALSIRNACQNPDSPDVIALCRNLVRANLVLGNNAEPEKDISKVLSYDRAHLAPNAPDYLFDLLSLATLKFNHGDREPARFFCEEVLKAEKAAKDQNTLDQADAYSLLARISAAEDQWHEASSLAGQACAIRRNLALPEALSVYDFETLAEVASAQGQIQDAEGNFQKALAIRSEQFNSDQAGLSRIKEGLQSLHNQLARAKDENHLSTRLMPHPE